MNNSKNKIIAFLLVLFLCCSIVTPSFATIEAYPYLDEKVQTIQVADIVSIETIPVSELDNISFENRNKECEYTGLTEKPFLEDNLDIVKQNTRGITGVVTAGISSCTDKTVTVSLLNLSNSTVRTTQFKLTVSGNAHTGPYSMGYLIGQSSWPVGLTNVVINTRQVTCREKLELTGQVAPSQGMFEVMKPAANHRELNDWVYNQWHKGSFKTVQESLNYHFYTHKNDRYIQPIQTIVDYCKSAADFLALCKSEKIPGKSDPNRDPGVLKYKKDGVYILATGQPTQIQGPIYSYGGN